MTSKRIYLDYAASAPLRASALKAWLDYHQLECGQANPNSLHSLGREASQHLEQARKTIATCLGSFRPTEVIFTSGGTESNNLALLGIAEGTRKRNSSKNRVVMSAIEHDSVLDVATLLRSRGFEVAFAKPSPDGTVSAQAIREVAGDSCALISVMVANNETGVVQPMTEIAQVAHELGVPFHVDAIQGFGRMPFDFSGADAVSIAAHKIGGPVGIGALALRARTPFIAQSLGGGQESGKRPGTQDVASAVAFAAAATEIFTNLESTSKAVAELTQHVYKRLCADGTGILPTTNTVVDATKLPGIVNIMMPSLDSETLVLKLDDAGFEVSAGSACSSGSLDPSHVLSAMGIPRDNALGALRISFDERVSKEDLDAFCNALLGIVE